MSPRTLLLAASALVGASLAPAALAQNAPAGDFAVTGATVAIGDGSAPIPNGTVVVRGGKVVAAGANVAVPPGVRVIDGTGKWVTPGLVVAVTDLGLLDVGAVEESNDEYAEKAGFNAALDVSAAIDPDAAPVAVNRAGGVTRAAVAPVAANAIFAGQGAIVDLAADANPVQRPRAFQYVELGERGADLAGGSRVAAQAVLRNALREAADFDRRAGISRIGSGKPAPVGTGDDIPLDPRLAQTAQGRADDGLLTHFDAAALIPVVTGRQPLYVHVDRAADIRAVLALKKDFPALRLVLVGAAEGWRTAREIAAAGVPVLASAMTDLPGRFETQAATQSNVGRMMAAGVKVGLGGFYDNDQPRYAPQYAGNLVALTKMPGATGLTWGQALAAITSVPAEIIGEGARFGSLKPGLAGDVVIWDGDPLELASGPVEIYIDGILQSLVNHQTRLRDRYRHPHEGALPKAYE
ncbi:amidohydrolase family protein [Novosphingobium sp. KCTC 2891]|uniref:amidohydrolase family protein n=1 Tax=Novosphingobium sp. KCTC 2891 TaxID=2989730 RepID=UPI002222D4AC|nr:amidohydrolase family protein [Novosphingobium sp. KCTC 2891]MCW1382192.1 amidohydrolase family protein [Novosphingobium sp. KCTC 2891]